MKTVENPIQMQLPNLLTLKYANPYSVAFACIALLLGFIGLSGWILDSFVLRSFFSRGDTMKANTALLIITCSISMLLLNTGKRTIAALLFIIVGLFCLLVLSEHIYNIDLGIDEWLFKDRDFKLLKVPPGRAAPFTAISLATICCITLLAICKKYYASQLVAFVLFLVLYTALLGKIFDATFLYRQVVYTGVALHTSISLFLLSTSALLYQSKHGWLELFVSEISGRRGLSYLLIYLFSAAPLLIALFMYVTHQQHFSATSGIIMLVVVSALISVPIVYLLISNISKAETRLYKANQRLNIALSAAKLGTYELEITSGKMQCSDQCLANFGLPAGTPFYFSDLIKATEPNYRQQIQEQIQDAVNTKSNYNSEFQIRWPDDSLRWIKVSGMPQYDKMGNATNMIGITQDLTAEKEIETKKNIFIGIVSHELKTPLTSVKAYVQLLKSKTDAENTFTISALTKSDIQLNKMTRMINSFLDVARLESGRMQLKPSSFSINQLLQEVTEEYRFISPHHIIQCQTCQEMQVIADREKIGHVIGNLIGNAVKYSTVNTTIEISGKRIENMIEVCVKDEGMGINEIEIPKLFNRFFRAESHKNNSMISGFGIGLYLSSEIVKMHKGKIWVESQVDKGSSFYFTIPIS
jgi:signal transduction histidine kinase